MQIYINTFKTYVHKFLTDSFESIYTWRKYSTLIRSRDTLYTIDVILMGLVPFIEPRQREMDCQRVLDTETAIGWMRLCELEKELWRSCRNKKLCCVV